MPKTHSISTVREHLYKIIYELEEERIITITRHGKAAGYLVSAPLLAHLVDFLDGYEDLKETSEQIRQQRAQTAEQIDSAQLRLFARKKPNS